MATYRTVHLSFWDDAKVVDDFTPEDKYFYLYLLTNPHTNICGCYQISIKHMARETGYNDETVIRLLKRFDETHGVCRYDFQSKELIVWNWHKYNWTKSPKMLASAKEVINHIKNEVFKNYISQLILNYENNSDDTVSIPYEYSIDTSVSVTVSDSGTESVSVSKPKERKKEKKESYGEYGNVKLTEDERNRLANEYGEEQTQAAVTFLDEYIEEKGYKSKSHNLAIRRWVMDAVGKNRPKKTNQPAMYSDDWWASV